MDYRRLTRLDLAMLFAAVGNRGRLFVSLVRAVAERRGLHLHVERVGREYVLVCIETSGDVVTAEHRLPVAWGEVDETVRLAVLHMYLDGVLTGCDRWRRRMARAAGGSGGRVGPPGTTRERLSVVVPVVGAVE